MFLSRFWGNARRKEGQEFRSLEVRGKLIALKNRSFMDAGITKTCDEPNQCCCLRKYVCPVSDFFGE